ncbi:MAG: diaminopimelate epimerase, partial [Betaproteobacteria bacterium AqS2]|nr:diaminopimelate epimerase [Betaproteobacteria bacterium AqS2]
MTTETAFAKLHGLGNDFVLLDLDAAGVALTAEQVRFLADRRLGVGADQVLALAARADGGWDYRIWNADGGEVGQCGNGARAAYAYLARHGRVRDGAAVTLRTSTTTIEVTGGDTGPRARLGVPAFAPAAIPLRRDAQADLYEIEHEGQTVAFAALAVGNPHACVWTDDLAAAPLASLGTRLNEEKQDFPEGVNLSFLHKAADGTVAMRVHERGAGETPACGSAAA